MAGDAAEALRLHHAAIREHTAGRHEEAERLLGAALAEQPADATLHNTLGSVQLARGDLVAAERALREALRLQPGYPQARFNLAMLLLRAARPDAALAELELLLSRHPDFPPALVERAALWLDRGRAEEALGQLRAVLAREPANPRLAALTAIACERAASERFHRGDAAGAVEGFALQRRLAPRERNPHYNLALALNAQGRAAEAIDTLAAAAAAGHEDAALLGQWAVLKAQACDWDGLDALLERLHARALQPSALPMLPQHALYFERFGAADQRRIAELWAATRPTAPHGVARAAAANGPVRVGFLSGELGDHPNAYLMTGAIEAHDRERFEFIAYATRPDDGSAHAARLRRAFDRVVDVAALDDASIAERIRADALHVLLDVSGHIEGGRPGVAALRPAPLQGHFLGYPGTLGMDAIGFLVADAWTVPPALEPHYRERILRLTCYQPNEPPPATPATPAPPRPAELAPFTLVFCSFNQPVKITPPVFARWCRLLAAVPGSCLWIGAFHALADANLRRAAAARGIDPARLVTAPRLPRAAHLARLVHADIALDTFPYTSHTTASDMLAHGVPLVTCHGETFASRVAASVLHAAGCGDWVHADADAAFAATLALARDPQALAQAKRRALAARASPLYDPVRYAREFEGLLLEALGLRP